MDTKVTPSRLEPGKFELEFRSSSAHATVPPALTKDELENLANQIDEAVATSYQAGNYPAEDGAGGTYPVHVGMRSHDGFVLHSHEVRADHAGVESMAAPGWDPRSGMSEQVLRDNGIRD